MVDDLLRLDGKVNGRSAPPPEGLVDHDARVGHRVALALGPGAEEECAHGRGEAEADGGNVAAAQLHRVVDAHAWQKGVRVSTPYMYEFYKKSVQCCSCTAS